MNFKRIFALAVCLLAMPLVFAEHVLKTPKQSAQLSIASWNVLLLMIVIARL